MSDALPALLSGQAVVRYREGVSGLADKIARWIEASDFPTVLHHAARLQKLHFVISDTLALDQSAPRTTIMGRNVQIAMAQGLPPAMLMSEEEPTGMTPVGCKEVRGSDVTVTRGNKTPPGGLPLSGNSGARSVLGTPVIEKLPHPDEFMGSDI